MKYIIIIALIFACGSCSTTSTLRKEKLTARTLNDGYHGVIMRDGTFHNIKCSISKRYPKNKCVWCFMEEDTGGALDESKSPATPKARPKVLRRTPITLKSKNSVIVQPRR